jgi:hypothetical protein
MLFLASSPPFLKGQEGTAHEHSAQYSVSFRPIMWNMASLNIPHRNVFYFFLIPLSSEEFNTEILLHIFFYLEVWLTVSSPSNQNILPSSCYKSSSMHLSWFLYPHSTEISLCYWWRANSIQMSADGSWYVQLTSLHQAHYLIRRRNI